MIKNLVLPIGETLPTNTANSVIQRYRNTSQREIRTTLDVPALRNRTRLRETASLSTTILDPRLHLHVDKMAHQAYIQSLSQLRPHPMLPLPQIRP